MGGRTVFHGGTVFDGTGADLAHADVLIEDGRIVEVGSDIDADGGIDCAGKAVLPGLFDTHVHLVSRYEDFDEVRVVYPVRSSQAMTRSRSAIRTFRSAGLPSTSRFRGNLFFRRLVD